MRLKAKVLLLAALPLLLSLLAIGTAMLHQQTALARHTHALVREAYMQARRAELKHYVDLAVSTLRPMTIGTADDDVRNGQQRALRALGSLDYGHDGYFFIYDQRGRVLMHSRQPELVGQDLWTLRDTQGRPTIQLLLTQARAGGGYVEYLWRKPSTGQMVPKLGYVTMLQPWGWMIGTGLYLDDIQTTLDEVDLAMDDGIRTTLGWLMAVAALGTVGISVWGLMLNLNEHREADAKLRLMAHQVVQSQEDERAHLARELHDGTSQMLVASKLLIESAVDQLHRAQHVVPPPLPQALTRINDALNEVRHLSHSLRPALLDTLGLPAALTHLGNEFGAHTNLQIDTHVEGPECELPEHVKTVLFRVAQEALTNVAKHAHAQHVDVTLSFEPDQLELRVNDNGQGFDTAAVLAHPTQGIGLRNMRERLATVGGRFEVHADVADHDTTGGTEAGQHGTLVLATVPRDALKPLPSATPPTA